MVESGTASLPHCNLRTTKMDNNKVATQDDRTMAADQAQSYMTELRAREVPYSFQPLSRGLVTVSTPGAYAVASYEALVASEPRASR